MMSQYDPPGGMGASPVGQPPSGTSDKSGVATITAANPPEKIGPNFDWLKSFPDGGIIRAIIIVTGIIAMACAAVTPWHYFCLYNGGARSWFLFVSATGWLTTLAFSGCYFFNVNNVLKSFPWIWTEMIHNGIWTVLYFIAAIVEVAIYPHCEPYVAAAVFGFILVLLYGIVTFFAFRKFRERSQ